MISLKKRNQGFTIVELLIVIVVIGILALLVVTTYSGIQQKARNNDRTADVKSMHTQLEAFFSENGYYPTRAHLNDNSWRDANGLKGLDDNALKDPRSTCDPTSNSGTCLVAAPAANTYSYVVTDAANADCSAAETTCSKYTLTGTYEGTVNGSTTVTKSETN